MPAKRAKPAPSSADVSAPRAGAAKRAARGTPASTRTADTDGRTAHLVVRLRATEKRQVEAAAASVHLRVSDWVRQVVLSALDDRG
jgi:hypothetical protein